MLTHPTRHQIGFGHHTASTERLPSRRSTAPQLLAPETPIHDRRVRLSSALLKMTNRLSWIQWLPGVLTLRQYQAAWLPHDIVAGIVLVTMLVPVGIAYALASGVPGIYGLYATIVPLLAYAIFGPSRILVLGP